MNYAAEAHLKANYYETNRKLTGSDGVFPTETMRLHHRIFGWHRKRQIPVVDASAQNKLNAYLIDPKYLTEHETNNAKDIPVTYIPSNLRVYQYSRLTRNYDSTNTLKAGPLSSATGRLLHGVRLGFGAFASDLMARYRALRAPVKLTHYAVDSGASPWWKQRIRLFATAVITGGLLIAAVAFTPDNATKPSPVSAQQNSTTTTKEVQGNNPSKSSVASTPESAQTSSTPQQTGLYQQPLLSTPAQRKLFAQQPVTSTASNTLPTTSTPTSSTSTQPTSSTTAPSTSTPSPTLSTVTDPILTPVTNAVNDVLSTQITTPTL